VGEAQALAELVFPNFVADLIVHDAGAFPEADKPRERH
jgi:hypothetical protein